MLVPQQMMYQKKKQEFEEQKQFTANVLAQINEGEVDVPILKEQYEQKATEKLEKEIMPLIQDYKGLYADPQKMMKLNKAMQWFKHNPYVSESKRVLQRYADLNKYMESSEAAATNPYYKKMRQEAHNYMNTGYREDNGVKAQNIDEVFSNKWDWNPQDHRSLNKLFNDFGKTVGTEYTPANYRNGLIETREKIVNLDAAADDFLSEYGDLTSTAWAEMDSNEQQKYAGGYMDFVKESIRKNVPLDYKFTQQQIHSGGGGRNNKNPDLTYYSQLKNDILRTVQVGRKSGVPEKFSVRYPSVFLNIVDNKLKVQPDDRFYEAVTDENGKIRFREELKGFNVTSNLSNIINQTVGDIGDEIPLVVSYKQEDGNIIIAKDAKKVLDEQGSGNGYYDPDNNQILIGFNYIKPDGTTGTRYKPMITTSGEGNAYDDEFRKSGYLNPSELNETEDINTFLKRLDNPNQDTKTNNQPNNKGRVR